MMRSLYWKIFLSFWLATILIIITTAWVTSQITKKSSIPVRERVFMNSYANAAVATFESGQHNALHKWLKRVGLRRHMSLYLVNTSGEIIGSRLPPPEEVKQIQKDLIDKKLSDGVFKKGSFLVSHEIIDLNGVTYRLVAELQHPIGHLIKIPIAGLTIRLTIAIFISGLICYLLSLYLTQPLRTLQVAAKSIARGKFSTRVGNLIGHHKDEIAELSNEFDQMAERLEQIISSKQLLLQDISHELRSPLARLQIAVELARTKTDNSAAAEFERMENEITRLNELIGEILDLARMNKSTIQLSMTNANIREVLQNIIDDANFEFGQKKPRVLFENAFDTTLFIDAKLLNRAFENVIRNALRYSDKELPVIVKMSKDENRLNIEITDSGPGVPDDQLDKIFNPFHRVDSSREKKTGGYGLGLAIVKQAIRLHDGNVSAQNTQPHGLSITISLPINKSI
jgi:two-component system sensor histidine kinase CpxA